ncbi:hypothetical protein KGF57_004629 [Candida theae]|uniref:Myb-like domain-containing protein n=1 Tax=Candida theae TaxID=1198502 RepID=A0AAD5FX00_9ASCO|nr:uncharacterized protein KGF57_004629 [Candida theae]KAI5949806.1 hypothetical protein KGF57_004629 [Candida theae]
MITLMGNKDIFKPSTYPKRKRKNEQAGIAKPRSLRYKPSTEALNLITKQTNLPEAIQSESDTSLQSISNQDDSKLDVSFTSRTSQDRTATTEKSAPDLPSSSNSNSNSNSTFVPEREASPILPHINMGRSLTLPSRHVKSELDIRDSDILQATATSQQTIPSLSTHQPTQTHHPSQHTHTMNPTYQHQQNVQYYFHSPQHQSNQSFQSASILEGGPYRPSLIPLQQMPGAYIPNQELYLFNQQHHPPPHHSLPQQQYTPMNMASYYQYPAPSSSQMVQPPQQMYYNVLPYSVTDPPYANMHGMPRKSKQSSTWSADEDKVLRELKEVQKLGWREISSFFQDRTPNACQFRWRRIISNLDANSRVPSSEAFDREKVSNSSSTSVTQIAIQEELQSPYVVPASHSRGNTDDDKDEVADKESQKSSNKIDFLLN